MATREENIALLERLAAGEIGLTDLLSTQVYLFSERSPGVFTNESTGKEYNQQEFDDFCRKVKERGKDDVVWLEQRTYPNILVIEEPNETNGEANASDPDTGG